MNIYENPQHDIPRLDEYRSRVVRLIIHRGMTVKAAEIVIDAAMYGKGCTEGEVRAKIQAELEAANDTISKGSSGEIPEQG